jgi:hypothetical protein
LVTRGEAIIVHAIRESETILDIPILNLKPLGINIFGDKQGIFVGLSRLEHNVFNNVPVMIGIGE